ncbi:DUF305 domain-containing protein [Flaviflagellibacter deserti]|uniref:DUF305 domain-containing protein n=2 Tax=Flaviflagellibacter deserti TaxID=2267266 RepID=A0ABV9Z227_9HYPH
MKNTMKSIIGASVIAAMMSALPAAAQTSHGAAHDTPAAKANMEAHQKMMDTMNGMKPTGDADKDFVMMMIPHHQGAIDMAEVELKYGRDPELKKMAEKIIADQKKEIGEMKKWQSANK